MKEYYELTILTEKDELETIGKFLDGYLKNYHVTDDGEKTLAYPIQGCEKGHYYFISWMLLTQQQALQLEKDLYSQDWSMRHLLLKQTRTSF